MLPDHLQLEYSNFKRTPNHFQRFHKIIGFYLLLQKNIVAVLYSLLSLSNYKNYKIEKYILENFRRPTEGIWFGLLEQLRVAQFADSDRIASCLNNKLSINTNALLNTIYTQLIPGAQTSRANTIVDLFQKIVSLKNRFVSHGMISEDTAEKLNEVLEAVLDELLEKIIDILRIQLFMVTEDGRSYNWKICNIDNSDCTELDVDKDLVNQEGIYLLVENKLLPCWPFISCRDGMILFYNRFESDTQKAFFSASAQKENYIRVHSNNVADLFEIDADLLKARPLEVSVQVSESQVSHNLPRKEYSAFIGRKKELSELETAMQHPRHFLVALDGIGGVGKSAIAIEYCHSLLHRESKMPGSYEYIVWLSAKSTIFKDGKIITMEQSFEHLEQLLDTSLIILGFPESINYEMRKKRKVLTEILECTKVLFVLDNLETLKPGNISEIWSFINNEIPSPSKVLLTSREYHQNVPQTIRIENLSEGDSKDLINAYSKEIGIADGIIEQVRSDLVDVSSGLPIVIKSILGQIRLGKTYKAIKREIDTNTDNIAKFCFEKQLSLLNDDQITVLSALCLSSETLDHDALAYIVSDLITSPILESINQLVALSIIKINYGEETTEYSLLPLIRTYVTNAIKDKEKTEIVRKAISSFLDLRDVESYTLLPIEERTIEKGALIPRKLVDKAMQCAGGGEFEQAEIMFKKATKDFENESYVWYIYSQFKAQYQSNYKEAITCLKRANEVSENYIYPKKMGDYNLKLKNFQAAAKNYRMAMTYSTEEKNKQEMLYSLALTEFEQVRNLRRAIRGSMNESNIEERNCLYRSIIESLEKYLSVQPHIYNGKKIRIFRILAESYFGLHQKERALDSINKAIDMSEYDDSHVEYRHFIISKMGG